MHESDDALQYEDEREKKWRIQAVSVGPGSFENRRYLTDKYIPKEARCLSAACVFLDNCCDKNIFAFLEHSSHPD